MTPRPLDAGAFAERLYAQLDPYAAEDEAHDWALLVFLGGLGQMNQAIEDVVSDGPNGEIGWSALVDLDRAPDEGVAWLGQFVGVDVNPNLAPSDQRQQLHDVNNWRRGSLSALRGAPAPYLTGTKAVVFRERDAVAAPSHPAYGLTVITYTDETPDSAAVLAALLAQKPAGIVLNYRVLDGQDYESVYVNQATYQSVYDNYLTYQGLMNDEPGT